MYKSSIDQKKYIVPMKRKQKSEYQQLHKIKSQNDLNLKNKKSQLSSAKLLKPRNYHDLPSKHYINFEKNQYTSQGIALTSKNSECKENQVISFENIEFDQQNIKREYGEKQRQIRLPSIKQHKYYKPPVNPHLRIFPKAFSHKKLQFTEINDEDTRKYMKKAEQLSKLSMSIKLQNYKYLYHC